MPDNADYIADYLSGGLSPEEMKKFEARLAKDEELNREYQLLAKGMEYLKVNAMLEEIEKDPDLPRIEAEVEAYFAGTKDAASGSVHTPAPEERKFRKALVRAIPAAILIGGFLVIRSFMIADPTTRLFEKYYEPLSREATELQVVRGETESDLHAGIECYLAEDYICAVDHFEKAPDGSFFLGLSLLGLERYEDALNALLVFQKENPEYPEGNWYLGLSYLRLDKPEDAIKSLNHLSSMNSSLGIQAKKLVWKIEKMKATGKEDN